MIFEDNQVDLEVATEHLFDYSECRAVSERPEIGVLDKYKYCERRRNVRWRHVHEGYENDSRGYAE